MTGRQARARSQARAPSLALTLVLCATALSALLLMARASMVTGGAGSALWFERERSDVLGVQWRAGAQPLRASTLEMWVSITDTMNKDHSVVGFSEFDGSGAAVIDNPDAYQWRFSTTRFRFYRGDARECSTSSCTIYGAGWTHWAVTWDPYDGTTQFFRNGQPVTSAAQLSGGFFRLNMTLHGSLLFGQEPDSYAGLFDETQSFSGLMDEVRWWSGVRTPAEIAAYWNVGLSTLPAAVRTNLAAYYDFDDAAEYAASSQVTDRSGHNNIATGGFLPNSKQWATYASGTRFDSRPTAPVLVGSSAPIAGNAPVVCRVNLGTTPPFVPSANQLALLSPAL
jgi:hypothetical protein